MHFFTIVAAALFSTSVLAAPTMQYTNCGLTSITVDDVYYTDPKNATNNLPKPLATEKLAKLVIGVGSQNYSCVNGVPTANGAYATLYDASCPIKYDADYANLLTPIAVKWDPTNAFASVQAFTTIFKAQLTVGVHYFKGDFSTPAFEFDNNGGKFYGSVANKVTAPTGSSTGKAPDNYGAVPSLKLASKAGMGSTFSTVYRLHTAGGSPPTSCDWTGQKKIPYSALYYFYKSS